MSGPTRPTGTCLYDGECGVCTRLAGWVAPRSDCGLRPFQRVDLATHGISEEAARRTLHWLDPDGAVTARGAAAVAEVLLTCRGPWSLLGRLLRLPGVRTLAEVGYWLVARNRHRLPGCAADAPRVDRGPRR